MVIWQIRGNEIGPEGNGAYYFATKGEADAFLREYREGKNRKLDDMGHGPDKLVIRNRDQLADALNAAMGFGAT